MKIRLQILVLFLVFIFWGSAVSAVSEDCYRFPSAKEISVKVNVSIREVEDVFIYKYELLSYSSSVQEVWMYMVKYLSKIDVIESPAGWAGLAHRVEPVISWWSRFPEYNIKAGDSLEGFVLKSKGIPTILTYYTRGWFEPEHFPEGSAPEPCPDESVFTNAVQGKTIGPTAPPADFKPLEFLDYIINLKHEAVSLGWITNKGIENSLDAKLDNAKKKLEQDNATSAKNILNAFLKEVEAQGCKSSDKCPKGKHLTSEAYALLKYNVQYLIEHL